MIDTKSRLILKILANSASDGGYKIFEVADIIMALPAKYRMDSEAVKNVLTHLERQDLISVKYDDDGVFCLAVLPLGFEALEGEKSRIKKKQKTSFSMSLVVIFSFLSAFFGTVLGIVLCYFLLKLF